MDIPVNTVIGHALASTSPDLPTRSTGLSACFASRNRPQFQPINQRNAVIIEGEKDRLLLRLLPSSFTTITPPVAVAE